MYCVSGDKGNELPTPVIAIVCDKSLVISVSFNDIAPAIVNVSLGYHNTSASKPEISASAAFSINVNKLIKPGSNCET